MVMQHDVPNWYDMHYLASDIPSKRRFRVGLVGGGSGALWAPYHRTAMRLSNRFDIVAGAFSSNNETRIETANALNIETSRNYDSFVAMAEQESSRTDPIDVAVVVTPNHLHFEPCRMLLEAGIPVICDKPLVNSLDEALALLELVGRKSLFFGMTYTYTGYPMVRDAYTRIRQGEIGKIKFLYVEYLLEWLAGDTQNLSTAMQWRLDPRKAGQTAALGDVGTHAFNLIEFLSGQNCTALNAKFTPSAVSPELDEQAVIQMEFDRGAEGLLWASLASPGHRNGLRFKIVGTKATMEWSQEEPEVLSVKRLGRAELLYRRGASDMTADAANYCTMPQGSPEGYLEALAILYSDFATALDAGDSWKKALPFPLPDIHQGVRGVGLSALAVESNKHRTWVPFKI